MTYPFGRTLPPPAVGAVVLIASLIVPVARAQGTGTIRGQVTDAITKRPVDGVHVYVAGSELGTLTGADGRYQLNLRAGEIELRARRGGVGTARTRGAGLGGPGAGATR